MPRTPDDILDELLVLRVQDGEHDALDSLTARWQPRLLRHARHLTADSDGAAEVVQETWLAVVRGIRRLNDSARFRGWVFRILQNKAVDWVRNRSRERDRQKERKFIEPQSQPRDLNIEDNFNRAERIVALRSAMRELSLDHRAVLNLHYREGLSMEDISHVLNVPPGTVKSRLYHAREHLRQMLETKGV